MAGTFVTLADSVLTPLLTRYLNSIAGAGEEAGRKRAERVVRLIVHAVPRLHRTALRNLEIAFPGLSLEERTRLAEESYRKLGENLYWFARLGSLELETVRSLVDLSQALPLWHEAQKAEAGTLMITAHYGNFELFAQALTAYFGPFNILYRDFGWPKLDRLWTGRRERFGSKTYPRKGAFNAIVRGLQQGQNMGLLFDQNVKRKHAAFIDLFGVPAATTKAIGYAALKTECPVMFGVCMENPPGSAYRYRVDASTIPNPITESGSNDEKIEKFLIRLNVELEKVIRAAPENWYWIHRRWKTRPDGEAETIYS